MSNVAPSLNTEALANTANNTLNAVNETATNAYANVNNALSEFSSKTTLNASQSFLESNSIIAKFAFIILVLIVFMFAAQLGIVILGYMMKSTSAPYIVKGMLPGTTSMIVTQNPKDPNSITINRSNNESTGIEFTWSVWLEIDANTTASPSKYRHIFNKGNKFYDPTSGIATVNNGPGLYISAALGEVALRVVMDPTNVTDASNTDVSGIPIGKWFNAMIRLENKILDVYINGTIAARSVYSSVPVQNYDDILVCQNSGFAGALSDLRYFASALDINAINNIVMTGPTLTANVATLSNTSSNYSYYLSNLWYSSKITSN